MQKSSPQNLLIPKAFRRKASIFVTSLALTPAFSYAAGFGFEYQSVRASARGNALVASTDSSALIHYNPAGLVYLDAPEFQSNTFAIIGELSVTREEGTFETEEDLTLTGATYYAHPFEINNRKYAFGIGLTTPYGLGITWPADTPPEFRTTGYESEMKFVQLNLAAAAEITPGFSIGAEILIAYSDLETVSNPFVGSPIESTFEGDDFAVGYQIGAHYTLNDQWSFGINYRSSMHLEHRGENVSRNTPIGTISDPSTVSFDLPEHVSFGLEYRPSHQWTLAAQAQWTNWSQVEGFTQVLPSQTSQLTVDWDSSWIYSIGLSYKLNKRTTLHAGYMYVESLIDNTTRTPLISDFEQQFVSTGLSHVIGDWTLDASFIYVFSKDEIVTGSIYGADGRYENSGGFINLGITKAF